MCGKGASTPRVLVFWFKLEAQHAWLPSPIAKPVASALQLKKDIKKCAKNTKGAVTKAALHLVSVTGIRQIGNSLW